MQVRIRSPEPGETQEYSAGCYWGGGGEEERRKRRVSKKGAFLTIQNIADNLMYNCMRVYEYNAHESMTSRLPE